MVFAAVNTAASLFYYLRWIAPAVRSALAATDNSTEIAARDRVLRVPAATVHVTAAISVLLGIGAGVWLAAVV